jgi:hypothetical protein
MVPCIPKPFPEKPPHEGAMKPHKNNGKAKTENIIPHIDQLYTSWYSFNSQGRATSFNFAE